MLDLQFFTMKIAPTVTNPKKAHLLPLVPEPADKKTADNSIQYQLRTQPTDADSPTYKLSILILKGGETVRAILKWMEDSAKILRGLNVTGGPDQYETLQATLDGTAKSLFNDKALSLGTAEQTRQAAAAAPGGARDQINA